MTQLFFPFTFSLSISCTFLFRDHFHCYPFNWNDTRESHWHQESVCLANCELLGYYFQSFIEERKRCKRITFGITIITRPNASLNTKLYPCVWYFSSLRVCSLLSFILSGLLLFLRFFQNINQAVSICWFNSTMFSSLGRIVSCDRGKIRFLSWHDDS